ncbi:Estradiol 17-beta-dehydrogenase 2 [Araneus ventricosus]|uniref:Estradiol 17-beta-dehydrogenase 2 n=1 Tax=Araneus ventricosus TaxID=182803 RepID=A0A4Y2B5J2_ARAVE|nr:Estradiol 17-beta-dehydrogenase 2 [Araneus ventricosus]
MRGKYTLVLALHLLSTTLILKIIDFILPIAHLLTILICSCISTYILWICIAWISFQYTKGKFLNEKVEAGYRAVFITGCDSGFGHELAKRLDSKGFRVFASCLFPDGKGASELKKHCSDRLHVLPLDVRQNESVEKAVEYVKENLGNSVLWAVVNNAGILKGFSVEMSTLHEFKDVLDVNFLGTVRVTKAFLPLLKWSKGRIVNVTSLGGEISFPFIAPYIASKFATVGFTDCLRHEIKMQEISVVSVEPEVFLTPMAYPATINKNLDLKKLEGAGSSFNYYYDEDFYASGYQKSLKDLINVTLSFACPDISIVVDDLELAVSLVHPDHTYKPRRHTLARFIFFCYEVMPRSCQILIVKIGLFVFFSESKILKKIVMKIISLII